MIGTGNTFLMQDGSEKRHLWIVLQIRPVHKEKICAIVNISSKRCPSKKCRGIIAPKIHSFLSKTSYIRCDHARAIPAKTLESLLKKGKIRLKEDCPPTLLEKIRQTVGTCSRSSKEVKDLL